MFLPQLDQAAQHIGEHGRPNTYSKWYASRHGSLFLRLAWCDMFASYCLNKAGMGVTGGEYASCPEHVKFFKLKKRWTKTPQVGALAFFDWDHDSVADHVGFVTKVRSDGKIETIEGNRGDAVEECTRSPGTVLGYGLLIVPARTYVVKKGDTLIGIAARFGVDWHRLYEINKKIIGSDPGLVKPGQKLAIPV